MKSIFRNIISFALAVIVLLSTFTFSITEYYCLDELVDFSLFRSFNNGPLDVESVSDYEGNNFQEKNCTDSIAKIIEGEHVFKTDAAELTFEQPTFSAFLGYSNWNIFESLDLEFVPLFEYPPPLLVNDIHVLDEVFLI